MRHWAIAKWALGLVLAAAMVGCEKDQPPERTTEYNPGVDAPPSNLVVHPNRDLLADQARVAEDATAQLAAIAERGKKPKAGPTDPKAIAVAGIVTKLIEAAKAGQSAALTALFDPADGEEMKGVLGSMAEIPAAWSEMANLLKEKKVTDIPASVKGAMDKIPGGPPLIALGDIVVDNLDYKVDGNSVVVTGAGTPIRFAPGPQNSWLIKMSAEDHTMYQAAAELSKAQAKFIKTLTSGLADSSVTPENLDEKAKALTEEVVKPAVEKLKEAVAAVKPGPTSGPASGPASAPAADAATPEAKPAADAAETPAAKPAAEDKDMSATPAAKADDKDAASAAGTGDEKDTPAAKPKAKTPPAGKAKPAPAGKAKAKPAAEE